MRLAPIVLFVYNRPWHTEQTLKALMANTLSSESVLYIYADGPKSNASVNEIKQIKQVREIIKKEKWCKEVIIIERKENIGLAQNIIYGVTKIINKYGNIIVLEDDIVTSIGFLKFMNDALSFYENNKKVMSISGYMYPHKEQLPETFFFNVTLCWGWATWKNSWEYFCDDSIKLWNEINEKKLKDKLDKFGTDYLSSQLAHNISGKLKTWFIKWHSSVLLNDGYTLFPKISLVDNIGFDNSGVHNGDVKEFKNNNLADFIDVNKISLIENKKAEIIIKDFYKNLIKSKKTSLVLKIKRSIHFRIRNILVRIFPEFNEIIYKNHVQMHNSYLGNQCKIDHKSKVNNSIIGNYTYIAENSAIINSIIGKFCSIGPNFISGWGVHPTNGVSTHPMFYSIKKQNGITLSLQNKIEELLPINIGNDVFIGMNVIILDGIKIGDGAIIGAGAVVSKDIPPYSIAVGSPIKIIKYRFDEEIIIKLLKIKWWHFYDKDLSLVEQYFFDIEKFIDECNKIIK